MGISEKNTSGSANANGSSNNPLDCIVKPTTIPSQQTRELPKQGIEKR